MNARAATLPRLAVATLVALAAVALGCGDGPGPSAEHVPAAAILAEERTLVDASRPTPPKSGFAGAASRTIATRLWYAPEPPRGSACGARGCALVVLAHGFGGATARFDAIARHLAGAGYVVAAPTFPLTNEAAPGGHLSGLADLVAQPGDVSFVIDELVGASGRAGDALSGRVDPERLGVVGHSLGGATVLALTRLPCCTDPRVDAVVAVAPASFLVEGLFGEKLAAAGPPTLSITGSEDRTVSSAVVRALHDALAPPRVFLGIPGAGHSDLIESSGAPAPVLEPTARACEAFFAAFLGGDRARLAAELDALAAEGQTVAVDL